MKLFLIILLAAAPVIAADTKAPAQNTPPAVDVPVGTFEEDSEDIWEKIRRMIFESRQRKQVRRIDDALRRHNPNEAQEALDTLLKEFPELKEQEPQAVQYHQANIDFWRGDFKTAYAAYDTAIKELEEIYPNGNVPRGKPYWENNASFLAELYLDRGVTAMNQQKYQQAVTDIDKAITVSPTPRAYMHINKCRALVQLNQYKEAADAYNQAYKFNPKWAANSENRDEFCAVLAKNNFPAIACQQRK